MISPDFVLTILATISLAIPMGIFLHFATAALHKKRFTDAQFSGRRYNRRHFFGSTWNIARKSVIPHTNLPVQKFDGVCDIASIARRTFATATQEEGGTQVKGPPKRPWGTEDYRFFKPLQPFPAAAPAASARYVQPALDRADRRQQHQLNQ